MAIRVDMTTLDYNLIIPNLYVGAHPTGGAEIEYLRRFPRVTAVLNLQTDDDLRAWKRDWPTLLAHYLRCGIEVRRVPIRDFDVIDLGRQLPEGVHVLNQLLQAGHTIYVHCTAGVWRAPTVVIAYLHWCDGWPLDEAFAHVKRQRPCSPSLEALRAATREFLADHQVQQRVRGEQ